MKTINVADATNDQLDWLVATIEGTEPEQVWAEIGVGKRAAYQIEECPRYTTDWSQMGPIMDRIKGFYLKQWEDARVDLKCEAHIHNTDGDWIAFGPTLLIAAARCYVTSKLGKTVEVPDTI